MSVKETAVKGGDTISNLFDQDLRDNVMKPYRPVLHVEVTKRGEIVEPPAELSSREVAEPPIAFEDGERNFRILWKHGELEIQILVLLGQPMNADENCARGRGMA